MWLLTTTARAPGHVYGGMVLPQIEAGAADLEAIKDDVRGANRDSVRASIADEVRGAGRVQPQGPFDDEGPAVDAGRDLDRRSLRRSRQFRHQPRRAIEVRLQAARRAGAPSTCSREPLWACGFAKECCGAARRPATTASARHPQHARNR